MQSKNNSSDPPILVETIASAAQAAEAAQIRAEVFGRECQCRIGDPMRDPRPSLHLIARWRPSGEPMAVLSVVETTGDTGLHQRSALPFGARARVARYTQLAVLRPYRGRHIPLRLIMEAHSRFVAPEPFEHTWLLFDAARAQDSLLCGLLGFRPAGGLVHTEFGVVRALVRDEPAGQMERGGRLIAASAVSSIMPPEASHAETGRGQLPSVA